MTVSARARRRGVATACALGDGATLVLLALVLFPFVWLVQMSFRPNTDILGYELAFTPTLAHYRALWTGAFPGSFVNSLVTSVASTVLALLIGVPAAYALSRGGFKSVPPHRAVDPRDPHGAADRLHHSVLSRLPLPRPVRHADRPDPRLPDLQPRAGDLDDEAILRQRAARAGGGRLDRRLRHLGAPFAGSPCRCRRPGSRRRQ